MPGIAFSGLPPIEPEPEAPMAEPVAEEKPAPPASVTGLKPKRARDEKGRLVADDPATPEVNEAFDAES